MITEIINTGTELMLGRTLNTHQQWLCRRLTGLGFVVTRQIAVADAGSEIEQALREALGHADLVMVTGGLGPTTDDLTRDCVARLLGRPLREDARVRAHLEQFFAARNRPMPAANRAQALVPEGARVLWNPFGTAPGLAIRIQPNPFREAGPTAWLVLLPGPPRELHPMFDDKVVPLLREELPLPAAFVCRTLRTVGIGESAVQEEIGEALKTCVQAGLELGYCAEPGRVDVRLAAHGPEAETLVQRAEKTVRDRLGERIFADGDEELEAPIVRLLTARQQTLALAESCTGGLLAHRITNVPGASVVFLAGLVTYSNSAKQSLLGVRAETLAQHGAVSRAVAIEMAEGARRVAGADYGLAVTGIAGPTGGSEAKPVGTVFVALAGAFPTLVQHHFNPWDRETFKQATATQGLDLLRRMILRHP